MDIPHRVTLYQAGELKLRELVTRSYHLDGVNDALAALAAGEGARGKDEHSHRCRSAMKLQL